MHLPGDLRVPPLHVRRLLGVERVGHRPQDEHVRLDATLALLLLALLLLLRVGRARNRVFALSIPIKILIKVLKFSCIGSVDL